MGDGAKRDAGPWSRVPSGSAAYEHIVRDNHDLDRVRRYIEDNPMAWALDEENPLRPGLLPPALQHK